MPKTLSELIEAELGIRTRPVANPLISTVDATPLRLFTNNPNRVALLVVNLSANDLYLLWRESVSSTNGMLLTPNGGVLNAIYKEWMHLVGYEWWCVGSAGSTDLFSMELVTY